MYGFTSGSHYFVLFQVKQPITAKAATRVNAYYTFSADLVFVRFRYS
jgi:hypothetical protein